MNAVREDSIRLATLAAYDLYARWTDAVAQYPETAEPCYLALGISDESGELQQAINDRTDEVLSEAGDVLWYASRYATRVLGLEFSVVIERTQKEHPHGLTGPRIVLRNLAIIAGVEKKRLRDGDNWDDEKLLDKTKAAYSALREVLAWVFMALTVNGYSVLDALSYNKEKLSQRLVDNTIKGDGDHR